MSAPSITVLPAPVVVSPAAAPIAPAPVAQEERLLWWPAQEGAQSYLVYRCVGGNCLEGSAGARRLPVAQTPIPTILVRGPVDAVYTVTARTPLFELSLLSQRTDQLPLL